MTACARLGARATDEFVGCAALIKDRYSHQRSTGKTERKGERSNGKKGENERKTRRKEKKGYEEHEIDPSASLASLYFERIHDSSAIFLLFLYEGKKQEQWPYEEGI